MSAEETITKKLCGTDEAIHAETEANRLDDWDSLYSSFKRFAHCDDAAISEGYSDSVGRLLSTRWGQFDKLYVIIETDKKFESFVLRHIDGSVPADNLKQILENAQTRCPREAERLCKSIMKAAQGAQ